ncbi:hypothetical protein IJ750_02585 [bacterium]|nr:hypothetical protein [bacterium]
MARDEITIQNPVMDNTESIGLKTITTKSVTVANGIVLKNAMACMNNTLFVVLANTASSDSTVTFKQGNKYPNTMLGDLALSVASSSTTVFQIQDPARFVDNNGDINIDFASGFTGTIYAIGKKVGL